LSVILLRHARAGDRQAWKGDDALRPLDERGRAQALALRDELSDREIRRIVSSPYRRCIETVEPLAAQLGLPVELDDRLAEGVPTRLARTLLTELDGGLACTHGDVIEAAIGHSLKKGAAAVIDVGPASVGADDLAVLEELPAP
jgi:8-oxo-dGTP diphosphatase